MDRGVGWREGKLFVPPPTFIGIFRDKRQLIFDIIVIFNRAAYLDICLTMNCKRIEKKITEVLLLGQTAADIRDVRSRVFLLQLKAILHMVNNEKLFGTTVAFVKVNKFQEKDSHTPIAFSPSIDSRSRCLAILETLTTLSVLRFLETTIRSFNRLF